MKGMFHEIFKDFPVHVEKFFPDRILDGISVLNHFIDPVFQIASQREDQVVLAFKIQVNGSDGHSRLSGDQGHGGIVKPTLGNQIKGHLYDVGALVGFTH